jgi:hypothetical protein
MGQAGDRLKRHRRRLAEQALQRIEVVVPVEDGRRLRDLAAALRSGEGRRDVIRRAIDASLKAEEAAVTGGSLFHFIGNPLFEDFELELPDRKSVVYRPVDFSEK